VAIGCAGRRRRRGINTASTDLLFRLSGYGTDCRSGLSQIWIYLSVERTVRAKALGGRYSFNLSPKAKPRENRMRAAAHLQR
jgi:hypothetical protein